MWPFRRRPRGRHALGAAVTAIPSTTPRVALPISPTTVEVPTVQVPTADVPTAEVPTAEVPDTAPAVGALPAAVPTQGPRVELGFRDGSTAALAPGSEQARALSDIASVLTQRD